METEAQIAVVLAGLSLWCWGYTKVLEKLHDLYWPDHIYVTVIIGGVWILIAMAIFADLGFITWSAWFLFFGACVAAGTPIVIWQRDQNARRRNARETIREATHATTNPGRARHS